MTQLISNRSASRSAEFAIRLSLIWGFAIPAMLSSCEKPQFPDDLSNADAVLQCQVLSTTRTDSVKTPNCKQYFSKLALQVFDAEGYKVYDKVKTQTSDDDAFGQLGLSLSEGIYRVVAVGHSSKVSPSIKSLQMVQFTSSDGEKLTDTFSYCDTITIGDKPIRRDAVMTRRVAMFRLRMTDADIPSTVASVKFDYKGGSANFNPSTGQGCTKSTQTETRAVSKDGVYEIYTFPYLSDEGVLQITATALSADGSTIRSRTFSDVPITRDRITTYRGTFFQDGDGEITQTTFGFYVDGEWKGEDVYEF